MGNPLLRERSHAVPVRACPLPTRPKLNRSVPGRPPAAATEMLRSLTDAPPATP